MLYIPILSPLFEAVCLLVGAYVCLGAIVDFIERQWGKAVVNMRQRKSTRV